MTNKTTGFELLATAAKFIQKDFTEGNEAWHDSPFEWVLHLPTGSKGSLGKRLETV
jgi:hypothetical protein